MIKFGGDDQTFHHLFHFFNKWFSSLSMCQRLFVPYAIGFRAYVLVNLKMMIHVRKNNQGLLFMFV
jgi:hypothetical protein